MRNVTRAEIAGRIDVAIGDRVAGEIARRAGISKAALSKYRRARQSPTVLVVTRLADALGVRVEWLLRGRKPMRAGAEAVDLPAIHEIVGAVAEGWDQPVADPERGAEIAEKFWKGFRRYVQPSSYGKLAPVVQVVFGNLLARAFQRLREADRDELLDDPQERGETAGRILGQIVGPRSGFDKRPQTTRTLLQGLVGAMADWESSVPATFDS